MFEMQPLDCFFSVLATCTSSLVPNVSRLSPLPSTLKRPGVRS